MGHDVCGFNSGKESSSEIAYLRRSAGNPLNRAIYEALDAGEHYCGVSGCGGDPVHFSKQQLEDALRKVPEGDEYEQEREFLNGCLANGDAGVWIGFW